MTEQQQREACAQLAKAMYPTAVIEPSSSDDGVDIRVYDKPNETRSWYGFNPFNSPEASRELVAWLAKQKGFEVERFNNLIADEVRDYGFQATPLQVLTAPLPVIARAACKALGIEVSE